MSSQVDSNRSLGVFLSVRWDVSSGLNKVKKYSFTEEQIAQWSLKNEHEVELCSSV